MFALWLVHGKHYSVYDVFSRCQYSILEPWSNHDILRSGKYYIADIFILWNAKISVYLHAMGKLFCVKSHTHVKKKHFVWIFKMTSYSTIKALFILSRNISEIQTVIRSPDLILYLARFQYRLVDVSTAFLTQSIGPLTPTSPSHDHWRHCDTVNGVIFLCRCTALQAIVWDFWHFHRCAVTSRQLW